MSGPVPAADEQPSIERPTGPSRAAARRVRDARIAARLRTRRLALGLRQSELAQELGVTKQQCAKYESGANRISGSMLWDLAEILAVDIAWFFADGDQAGAPHAASRRALRLAPALPDLPEPVADAVIGLVAAVSARRRRAP